MSKQHSTLSKGRYSTINAFDIVALYVNKVECCFDIVASVDGALFILPTSTTKLSAEKLYVNHVYGVRDYLAYIHEFLYFYNSLKFVNL